MKFELAVINLLFVNAPLCIGIACVAFSFEKRSLVDGAEYAKEENILFIFVTAEVSQLDKSRIGGVVADSAK